MAMKCAFPFFQLLRHFVTKSHSALFPVFFSVGRQCPFSATNFRSSSRPSSNVTAGALPLPSIIQSNPSPSSAATLSSGSVPSLLIDRIAPANRDRARQFRLR